MYVGIAGAVKIAITVIILVFVILGLLALLMVGLREVVKLTSKKEDKTKEVILSKEREMVFSESKSETVYLNQDQDEQLIAVISAAVSMFLSKPMSQIKVINIKRAVPAGASPWTITGRQNHISSRILINPRKKGEF